MNSDDSTNLTYFSGFVIQMHYFSEMDCRIILNGRIFEVTNGSKKSLL